ncbi:MAG: hypothetical protein ACKO0V_15800 [bacterium]
MDSLLVDAIVLICGTPVLANSPGFMFSRPCFAAYNNRQLGASPNCD